MNKFVKLCAVVLAFAVLYIALGKIARTLYPKDHGIYVSKYAEEYALSETLLFGIIKAESNFKQTATSHKNAAGLMQIMEPTGQWIAEKLGMQNFQASMLSDPETNIKMGCFYIRYLLDMYDGDKICALSAYNAGYANVDSWLLNKKNSKDGKTLSDIPFPETKTYVNRVLKNEKIYTFLYEKQGS